MDARQQRALHDQRPPFPQLPQQSASSSHPASVRQTSNSLTSIASINTAFAVQHPERMPSGSAPLPSPSANQPDSYFGSISSSSSQHQRIPQQQQQIPSQYVGQRGNGGGAPETAPYLQDCRLLAEAAKKAQMACLSRDLGDVGL